MFGLLNNVIVRSIRFCWRNSSITFLDVFMSIFISYKASVISGWCFLRGRGGFHVSGERGVPAGGAGEYPEVLLDGADHYEGRGGLSVRV